MKDGNNIETEVTDIDQILSNIVSNVKHHGFGPLEAKLVGTILTNLKDRLNNLEDLSSITTGSIRSVKLKAEEVEDNCKALQEDIESMQMDESLVDLKNTVKSLSVTVPSVQNSVKILSSITDEHTQKILNLEESKSDADTTQVLHREIAYLRQIIQCKDDLIEILQEKTR